MQATTVDYNGVIRQEPGTRLGFWRRKPLGARVRVSRIDLVDLEVDARVRQTRGSENPRVRGIFMGHMA